MSSTPTCSAATRSTATSSNAPATNWTPTSSPWCPITLPTSCAAPTWPHGGDAAFLVSDGRAETLSSVMGELRNGVVRLFDESTVDMTSSLGVAYGRITRYLGFVPNNDEYKVMGLAAYGPTPRHNPLLERVVRLHENGSYTISVPRDIGAYYALFDDLFGGDGEKREEFDFRVKVAGFAQHMAEAVTAHQLRTLTAASSLDTLLFEGGLALNCVANTKMLERSSFTGMEVSFGASDPGVAIGAAVYTAGLRNRPTAAVTTPTWGPRTTRRTSWTRWRSTPIASSGGKSPTPPRSPRQRRSCWRGRTSWAGSRAAPSSGRAPWGAVASSPTRPSPTSRMSSTCG